MSIEKMVMELANKCREEKVEFCIIIKDGQNFHSQSSVKGGLDKFLKILKNLKGNRTSKNIRG